MTQPEQVSIPLLPACQDGGLAELCSKLKEIRDTPVALDATDLGDVIPSLLLQAVLSAQRDWQGRDVDFTIVNLSAESRETLALLGMNDHQLNSKAAL